MSKTIIVSNRLPVEVFIKENDLQINQSAGGLATGMTSVHNSSDSLWIGWNGLREDETDAGLNTEVNGKLKEMRCISVPLSTGEINDFYFGFSNKTIWPLFHYFTEYTRFDADTWKAYQEVNRKFCNVILEYARPGDTIWINDYQLMLLPGFLRELRDDILIGFFLHIPFPSFEIFRILPWRKDILEGLLGADLIGFHTYGYEYHFLSSVRRILGYDITFNRINTGSNISVADAFPMGIDFEKYNQAAIEQRKRSKKSELQNEIEKYLTLTPGLKLVLSIDRLDYTKGISNRLYAFEYFLQKYPEYIEKVTLVMLTVPSRSGVEQYQLMKSEVDEQVGRINGKFSTVTWTPVWYFYRSMPFEDLIDLYIFSEIALILPIRDGMNLVAKEYIAAQTNLKGILILSEMAGAAQEMGEALLVNPNNYDEIAGAIRDAIIMNDEEKEFRNRLLRQRLKRYNITKWANDFIDGLKQTEAIKLQYSSKRLTSDLLEKILPEFQKARKRILFIDYDGTLTAFREKPELAIPDSELMDLLTRLSADVRNKLVLVSGRDHNSMDEWFGNMNCNLIAEHGAWMKEPGGSFQVSASLSSDWKDALRPILETFTDRSPGSFLEEKSYSLAWHYRKCDPELGSLRSHELRDELTNLIGNLNLEILEGNKVLEVKNAGVNKGNASTLLLTQIDFEFILAIGDDWTDEYLFREMPYHAYTVKVGIGNTLARFNVRNYLDVRALLERLTE